MPKRDRIHDIVKQALINDGWDITHDPYVISYGSRFLFLDLAADKTNTFTGSLISAEQGNAKIAVEIKELQGKSIIFALEQAIGQYSLYQLLLKHTDHDRKIYLAVSSKTYEEFFQEPIGKIIISDLPVRLVVVDLDREEVTLWIPNKPTEK